ncbi:hypothetical protein [Vibrio phage RYC]|nr:hypothetical protein [Vibrio phage RYC]
MGLFAEALTAYQKGIDPEVTSRINLGVNLGAFLRSNPEQLQNDLRDLLKLFEYASDVKKGDQVLVTFEGLEINIKKCIDNSFKIISITPTETS